jgi:hypothetical protein
MRRSIGGPGEIDLNQPIGAAGLSVAAPSPHPLLAEEIDRRRHRKRGAFGGDRERTAYLRCVCRRMLGRGALWLNAAPRWCFTG